MIDSMGLVVLTVYLVALGTESSGASDGFSPSTSSLRKLLLSVSSWPALRPLGLFSVQVADDLSAAAYSMIAL